MVIKLVKIGSVMQGKRWSGTSEPMVVLHTLEYNAWPNPVTWRSPSHYVYNPNTGALHEYIDPKFAAYSLRDNQVEDDYLTIQVEMWGRAASVPGYDNNWYRGVAELCQWLSVKFNIPLVFADFSELQYGKYAPSRMTEAESDAFTGFMGHGHFGRGIDTHWDPGKLDTNKVKSFLDTGVGEMPRILFEGLIDALFAADGEFQGDPNFWKKLIDDPTNYQWNKYFWPAFTRMVTAN